MKIDFSNMDFKEAVQWILEDWNKDDPGSTIQELNELIFCVDIDEILIHADAWDKFVGDEKPETDIELCGEHFYKGWR